MKAAVAVILLLIGSLMMIGGFAWAVFELAQLYAANLDGGVADTTDPKKTSKAMLTAAGIGLVGFVPMTIGSLMLGRGLFAWLSRKAEAGGKRR